MKIKLQQAADILQKADNILVLSHKSPDGDTAWFCFCALYGITENG